MKFFRALLLPAAFLFVAVMRLAYPRYLIRIGELWSPRLGHLIGNMECFLCEQDAGLQPKSFDFWFHVGESSNKAVSDKYAEKLHILPEVFAMVVLKVNCLFSGWQRHVAMASQVDRDIHNLWEKHAPHIGFTEAEEERGKQLIASMGMPYGAKWVCLIVRDSAYLPGLPYHDYRDADVDDYAQAATALAERGFWVLRMGAKVAKPFHVEHPRIIDYASLKQRSDFADLYLGAKCEFCLGTATGFMAIPQGFNRPLAVTDFAPLEYMQTFAKGLVIWKHHIKDGKRMKVSEILACGAGLFTFANLFEQEGITLQNNMPEEITDLALEMADGISTEDQSAFWNDFPRAISQYNNKPLHGRITLRIGREFLRQYAEGYIPKRQIRHETRFVTHHVGARAGTRSFPFYEELEPGILNVMYDADTECLRQVKDNWNLRRSNTIVLPHCLAGFEDKTVFHKNYDPYTSSIYAFNPRYKDWYYPAQGIDYQMGDACREVGTLTLKTRTLDKLIGSSEVAPPDFLSIDTQGSERSILRGAAQTLHDDVLGLMIEVEFHELYEHQPLFGSICEELDEHFDLADITFFDKLHPVSGKSGFRGEGFAAHGEALFLRNPASLDTALQLNKLAYLAIVFKRFELAEQCFAHPKFVPLSEHEYQRFVGKMREVVSKCPSRALPKFSDIVSERISYLRFRLPVRIAKEKLFSPDWVTLKLRLREILAKWTGSLSEVETLFLEYGMKEHCDLALKNRIEDEFHAEQFAKRKK